MTKNGVVWAALLVIIAVTVIVYSNYFTEVKRVPEQYDTENEKLVCWIYTDGWSELLSSYQETHPGVELEVRVFSSYKELHNELLAALSIQTAPQIVELDSSYGLSELVQSNALAPVSGKALLPEETLPAATKPFTYGERLWAVPAGVSVPVMFYNKDLMKWTGVDKVTDFYSLEELGFKTKAWKADLTARNSAGWEQALVMDDSKPFILLNLWEQSRQSSLPGNQRLEQLLRVWSGLVFDSKAMKPLRSQLAPSDFISGKTLFYMTNSNMTPWLDHYIAGKFEYDMLPAPLAGGGVLLPHISSFGIVAGKKAAGAAEDVVNYLASSEAQAKVLEATGYLPVRTQTIEAISRNYALNRKYSVLLGAVGKLESLAPSEDARLRWERITLILNHLEMEQEVDFHAYAAQLLPYMP
ncbi:sn-glycerol 3-phosphate transport system substrate-binding protein [Paenibacillus sophorae]|uniref:Extracellular solute-binding protein n=1 Tax=Paenibacillus sophorae TaxID=1333845 RepID=A0A1H8UN24_9BACL|nr:extracellular solute-binding protein [Paenibacillus sophorae]QWU13319.1 extracellular solute-binding protein [Paenibacillus sophorae]SEP04551.1 sn-glycerol 3-phosphate transport system substrate-binding protein [Paenibacillus sophorae]